MIFKRLKLLLIVIIVTSANNCKSDVFQVITGEAKATDKIIALQEKVTSRFPNEAKLEDIMVCAGSTGLQECIKTKNKKILAVYIASTSFYKLFNTLESEIRINITAVFSDPSPNQQIELARAIIGDHRKITVALSNNSEGIEEYISSENIEIIRINDRQIGSWLRGIRGEALVAIPDISIYNESTLRTIIRSLYKKRKPLIGYNEAMVNSGALASISISDEDMDVEITNKLKQLILNNITPLPSHVFVKKFTFNNRLARSLSIRIDEDEILNKLRNGSGDDL